MSWEADSWASNGGSYSDTLFAKNTIEQSYDDFTGRAMFYKSASEESPVNIDLFINDIQYTISEHLQFESMMGNNFSYIAFGKDALQVQVSAFLPDTGKNYGKDSMVDFYRNYLRMEAVARRGVTPILVFPDAAFYCAASSMQITESGDCEDIVVVQLTLEITAATFISTEYNFMLDYMHGVEVSEDSIMSTTSDTSDMLSSNVTVSDSTSKNS